MTNEQRAVTVAPAHDAFCIQSYKQSAAALGKAGGDGYRGLADLICNLGHLADRLGVDYTAALEHGAGMWSAERAAPNGEPEGGNDIVSIAFNGSDEPRAPAAPEG